MFVKNGIRIRPEVTVQINVHDPYAVTYKLTVHDNFVRGRLAIGVKYNDYENYLYGIEEILDSLVRSCFGALDIETVIEIDTGKGEKGEKLKVKEDIIKEIIDKANNKLEIYGVSVEDILISQVDVLDEAVLFLLHKKFEAIQNEKITTLQEEVEKAQVKVEIQRVLQELEKGKGKGSLIGEQLDILIKPEFRRFW